MKKYVLLAIIVIVVVVGCLSILYAHRNKPLELDAFEYVTLEIIGMRYHHTYEILHEPPHATLSRYDNVYENGEAVQRLDKTVICDQDALLELLQTCQVGKWNGFQGKHPRNVRDGVMFVFTAEVNDGQTIRVEGSENFPKGYREFVQALDQLLAE